jgi:ribonuclease T1
VNTLKKNAAFWLSCIVAVLIFAAGQIGNARDTNFEAAKAAMPSIAIAALPPEGQTTLQLIKKGGPFPYRKDGSIFGNRERNLPRQSRGYYKEYTVKTPSAHNRGARRIIAGEVGEYYYTSDHYSTFQRIVE